MPAPKTPIPSARRRRTREMETGMFTSIFGELSSDLKLVWIWLMSSLMSYRSPSCTARRCISSVYTRKSRSSAGSVFRFSASSVSPVSGEFNWWKFVENVRLAIFLARWQVGPGIASHAATCWAIRQQSVHWVDYTLRADAYEHFYAIVPGWRFLLAVRHVLVFWSSRCVYNIQMNVQMPKVLEKKFCLNRIQLDSKLLELMEIFENRSLSLSRNERLLSKCFVQKNNCWTNADLAN